MSHDEQAAALKHEEIVALLVSHEQLTAMHEQLMATHEQLATTLAQLTTEKQQLLSRTEELARQVEWFKRQLFGQKSERRLVGPDGRQLTLGECLEQALAPDTEVTVAEHRRRVHVADREEPPDPEDLRFDESVPVEEIRLPHPPLDEEHELVSEKTTWRLAQRPASYVVLKYVRPVVKRNADATLSCATAPASVLGRSVADVSLLANLVIDKFLYHLPLYRQHQRMEAAGIHLARSTLTGWVHRTGDLLQPIYGAQLASVLTSHVVAVDETPIKAGVQGPGRMKTGYFWPIYGDQGEVVFPFSESRSGKMLNETLKYFAGVLLSDGYVAYERYVAQVNDVVHAQCWSHTRRHFLEAEDVEPQLTAEALDYIRRLYVEEARIQPKMIESAKRLELRAQCCKPVVDAFFEWLKTVLQERLLLPRNPFTEAAGYALAREGPLRVFLQFPDVPIDTNHLERQIRPIALGRKNWLFCWTEIGAHYVGVFQSLLATCRLQGVEPYTYLVDVLQRVETHPMNQVALLTPRLWKDHFAADPLPSAIDRKPANAVR